MSTFPAIFYEFLEDANNPSKFLDDPTIEEGDFKISQNGTNFINLITLPVVSPAGSPQVKFELSENERSSPGALIYGKDQNGDEWREIRIAPSDCNPEITNTTVLGGEKASGKVKVVHGSSKINISGGSGKIAKISGNIRVGISGSGGPANVRGSGRQC